jgi:glyoxylase-like metal-dependent hydrolase (beta-lactamase superfamily II)
MALALFLLFALRASAQPLHIEVFTSDESSYDVTSTIIYGETEALLVDAQMHTSQAAKLAERIAHSGRRLKAIFITHPDLDHYIGLAVLHERFPEARIFMTEAALEEFKVSSAGSLARQKKNAAAETPDSLPMPEAVATTEFLVDGQSVLLIKDFQGDVLKPANSFLWIPSLRAVIAGDIVFDGVHPWLADSTEQTRSAWLHSLEFIGSLQPRVVVAGHRKDAADGNSPKSVDFMRRYLRDFEIARMASANADGLVAAMTQRYPALAQTKFLDFAAKAAYPKENRP